MLLPGPEPGEVALKVQPSLSTASTVADTALPTCSESDWTDAEADVPCGCSGSGIFTAPWALHIQDVRQKSASCPQACFRRRRTQPSLRCTASSEKQLGGSNASDYSMLEGESASSVSCDSFTESATLLVPDDESCVSLFDWDDTLFPTWFVREVVRPCVPESEGADGVRGSCFAQRLAEHARNVEALLRTARSIGRVGIVTLAARPWVFDSAEKYLLGINFPQLLDDLQIPVIYARDCVRSRSARYLLKEDGVSVPTIAKQAAMLKALKKLHGRKSGWKNIISIGDSVVERDAIKDLLWGLTESPLCKTVKMAEDPNLDQMAAQQTVLRSWLAQMALHPEDFDFDMDEADGRV